MNDETVTVQPAPLAIPLQQPLLISPAPERNTQRHFLAVFFISYMWGTFGIDRFYLGKIWTGLLKLVTIGGFGLWTIIDLVLIMSGAMRDKQGSEMLQADRYKKFAGTTILLSALAIGAIVLISGISLIFFVFQVLPQLMEGGGLEKLLPAGTALPGMDQLQGL